MLQRNPVAFTIGVSPTQVEDPATRGAALSQLLRDLGMKLRARGFQSRQAGFVLIFASGPVTGIGQAEAAATTVLKVIRNRAPGFSGTSGQGFWTGSGDYFQFEVFFFA